MRIRPVNMEFLYGTAFPSQSPEAYERLIMDAMRGDATLFTRDDEVEAQWRIIDPILHTWAQSDGRLPQYQAGSSGPRRRTRSSRTGTDGEQSEGRLVDGGRLDGGGHYAGRDRVGLRELLKQRHAQSEAYVPARVLNLVVLADREWRGEIYNRLESVGRYHLRARSCARSRAGGQRSTPGPR